MVAQPALARCRLLDRKSEQLGERTALGVLAPRDTDANEGSRKRNSRQDAHSNIEKSGQALLGNGLAPQEDPASSESQATSLAVDSEPFYHEHCERIEVPSGARHLKGELC